MKIAFTFIAAIVLVATGARTVHGQPASPSSNSKNQPWYNGTTLEQRQAARAVFLKGNELIALPNFAAAAEKYQRAIAIWDNPVFHYNLAIAQINLVQHTQAYESLERALDYGGAALDENQAKRARDYKASLEKQLARLEIVCSEPGAAITLDGKFVFNGPGHHVAMVQPGGHLLVARKRGYATETTEVVGNAGVVTKVTIAPRPPQRRVEVRRWKRSWVPWSVVGAGAILLAGASYLDRSSTQAFDQHDADLQTICGTIGCAAGEIPDSLNQQLSDARRRQWGARATYVAAVGALATGVILVMINRERVITIGESPSPNAISFAPMLAPSGISIRSTIRF